MRPIFTLIFLLPLVLAVAQQPERVVSGRLTSGDGSPLPGVNIVIKGTATGTVTDANGNYSIRAPIGSTLVFSFIGMKTREVVVADENLLPQKKPTLAARSRRSSDERPGAFLLLPGTDSIEDGVATLGNSTPVYMPNGPFNPQSIMAIRPAGSLGGKLFSRNTPSRFRIVINDQPVRKGHLLQFSSSFGFERVTRVPGLQTSWAQGRTDGTMLRWNGPGTNELFSWGPPIQTLEYDGTPYDFDQHGRLVNSGSGNGRPARAFDPAEFFQTGVKAEQLISYSTPALLKGIFTVEAGHNRYSGVIPGASSRQNNISLAIRDARISQQSKFDAKATYFDGSARLVTHGSNLANIISAVFTTPVSFDNTNALGGKNAFTNKRAYQLDDGTMRSYAPASVDNPYALARELPDKDRNRRFLTSTSITYTGTSRFRLNWNTGFDVQDTRAVFGIPPGFASHYNGRITVRDDQQLFFNTVVAPSWQVYTGGGELGVNFSWQANYQDRRIEREDQAGFTPSSWPGGAANSVRSQRFGRERLINELMWKVAYQPTQWIDLHFIARNYFSNTLQAGTYTNLLPSAGFRLRMNEIAYISPVDELQLFFTWAKSLREAPLMYSNWAVLSTGLEVSENRSFYESREIVLPVGLLAETEDKAEVGIYLHSFGFLQLDASCYYNTTDNFITPGWTELLPSMLNIGKVNNYGTNISVSVSRYMRKGRWGSGLRWSKYTTVVKELYRPEEYIPIGGFSTAAGVLAKHQPLGAIYGTTWKRDEAGTMIIGGDGFPVEDPVLRKIGNPIPDWTASLDGFLEWRRFRISTVFEFRHGGQVWNGTRAALDYSGRSAESGNQRTVAGYYFQGVNENGNVNNVPVSFYDPSSPIGENRWVRYGFDGVGEAYIEDASWFRMIELNASYTTRIPGTKVRELRFSLVGSNVFLVTPYTGVDPASELFGYAGNSGMDLFNVPTTRSFTARITLKM